MKGGSSIGPGSLITLTNIITVYTVNVSYLVYNPIETHPKVQLCFNTRLISLLCRYAMLCWNAVLRSSWPEHPWRESPLAAMDHRWPTTPGRTWRLATAEPNFAKPLRHKFRSKWHGQETMTQVAFDISHMEHQTTRFMQQQPFA